MRFSHPFAPLQLLLVMLMSVAVFGTSCTGSRVLRPYRAALPVDSLMAQPQAPYLIQNDDKISVSIWQHDDLSVGSVFGIYNSSEGYGKWVMVQPDGTIVLPKLGPLSVAGLTPAQASVLVRERLSATIVDPLVVVKVLNREVTVLGEVRTPGNYLLDQEQNTLSEIVGRAQGFTDYANDRHIILIRGEQLYRINLRTMPAGFRNRLYVQAGDLIEVPAQGGKRLDKKAPTLIPFASAMTALAIVFATFINGPS